MMIYVGPDISKDETAICVLRDDRRILLACKTLTEPEAISEALEPYRGSLERIVLETGRRANWLYGALTALGLPVSCVDARQAHAVLSQMHNETDENDALMLAEPGSGPIDRQASL